MKKIIYILTLLPLFNYSQQIPGYVPQDGLIGWWDFDGNALDDVDYYNNDGNVIGATPTSDRFGNPNSAYLFDGIDDRIVIPNSSELNPSEMMSVSIWFNTNVYESEQYIICKSYDPQPRVWSIRTHLSSDYSSGLGVQSEFRHVTGGEFVFSGEVYYETGEWNHVVLTYDGANIYQYFNGSLISETLSSGEIYTANEPISIGYMPHDNLSQYGYFFDGSIDEFGFWDRPLTAEEVQNLYLNTGYGCLDENACNYDSSATIDNGTCSFNNSDIDLTSSTVIYYISNCNENGDLFSQPSPVFYCDFNDDGTYSCQNGQQGVWSLCGNNFVDLASWEDESTDFNIPGTWWYLGEVNDFGIIEGQILANDDGGYCGAGCFSLYTEGSNEYFGCMDESACNYWELANTDDGSCNYQNENDICDYGTFLDSDGDGICDNIDDCPLDFANDSDGDGICENDEVYGCTDINAYNYNPLATEDNGNCEETVLGCTDPNFVEYNSYANTDDGSCLTLYVFGCMDENACNFNSLANYEFPNDCDYSCNDTVIQYVTDTIIQYVTDTIIQYVTDTVVQTEFVEIMITEYIDCETGLPCASGIEELIDKSKTNNKIYNLSGQEIPRREGIYIEDGEIKYRF